MILVKVPLRVSFFGGGSDIPEWFMNYGNGMTLSVTIDKHIYLAINQCRANHVKVIYSKLELESTVDTIQHDRVREALKYFNIKSNIEIASFSDVPTKGTGLGSSSTFTVGLVDGLAELVGLNYSKKKLAETAYYIERNQCNNGIGYQDQYAAAFGGLNLISYTKQGIMVDRASYNQEYIDELERNLLLFNTGIGRDASLVLEDQIAGYADPLKQDYMREMVNQASLAHEMLLNGQVDDFGEYLGRAWTQKKKLSTSITTPVIDQMYKTAIDAGALGGKLLGAGGGGYLLVYAPRSKNSLVRQAMGEYEHLPFKFTNTGSEIEYAS